MANRIQQILKQKRLDQSFVADQIGVTRAMFSRWFNNVSQPSWEQLITLSRHLIIDVNTLVYHEPVAIRFSNDLPYNLDCMGTGDIYLQSIFVREHPTQITIWMETRYSDGSIFKSPISTGWPTKGGALSIDKIVDNADKTKIWIEGLKEGVLAELLFLKPVTLTEQKICPKCDGFGSIGEGSAFFKMNEILRVSETCDKCDGKGFFNIQFAELNEMMFIKHGFHGSHIAFRTIESPQVFSGVILDCHEYETKIDPKSYKYIPTENLKSYQLAERTGKSVKGLWREINISTITWARQMN